MCEGYSSHYLVNIFKETSMCWIKSKECFLKICFFVRDYKNSFSHLLQYIMYMNVLYLVLVCVCRYSVDQYITSVTTSLYILLANLHNFNCKWYDIIWVNTVKRYLFLMRGRDAGGNQIHIMCTNWPAALSSHGTLLFSYLYRLYQREQLNRCRKTHLP